MHTSLLLRMIYVYLKIFYISRTRQYIFYIHILLYILYMFTVYTFVLYFVLKTWEFAPLSLSLSHKRLVFVV